MVVLPILFAILMHFVGPGIGAWLVSAGVSGTAAQLILGVGASGAQKLAGAAIEHFPHGPLTPEEKAAVDRQRAEPLSPFYH